MYFETIECIFTTTTAALKLHVGVSTSSQSELIALIKFIVKNKNKKEG